MRLLILSLALAGLAGAAQAKPAAFFRQAQEARIYGGQEVAGQLTRWRDDDCKSSFQLAVAGQPRAEWTIDWRKVFNARVSTRTSFTEDVLAARYEKEKGVVVVGRGAFATKLPDGTAKTVDNFEFFLTDQAKVEALVADMNATHQAC